MDLIVRCGTVVAVEGASCRVEMERERCAGCAGRCSAGLSLLGEVALEVASEPLQPPPAVGDSVSVGVPRRGMAAAAVAVFGLPLAAMAAGGASVEALGGSAAAGTVGGFVAGVAGAVAWGRTGRLAAWVRPRLVAAPDGAPDGADAGKGPLLKSSRLD